jgi:hypothetical protein
LEVGEQEYEADSPQDQELYDRTEGAETGMNRNPREVQTRSERRQIEPETEAHEGRLWTRTPKQKSQGITARTAEQESTRQEKVVKDRPDALAGVNRTRSKQAS